MTRPFIWPLTNSAASRRDMMGAALFVGLSGVAAVALATPDLKSAQSAPKSKGHPDAALLALCDEIAAIERQWAASVHVSSEMLHTDPRYSAMEAHEDALLAQQAQLVDSLVLMPTHTFDGYQARARLIAVCDDGYLEGEDGHRGMVWALVSALAGDLARTSL